MLQTVPKLNVMKLAEQLVIHRPTASKNVNVSVCQDDSLLRLSISVEGASPYFTNLTKENLPEDFQNTFPVRDVIFDDPSPESVSTALTLVNMSLAQTEFTVTGDASSVYRELIKQGAQQITTAAELGSIRLVFKPIFQRIKADTLTPPIPLKAVFSAQQLQRILKSSKK